MNLFDKKVKNLSRRDFLKTAFGGGLAISGLAGVAATKDASAGPAKKMAQQDTHDHGMPGTVGMVEVKLSCEASSFSWP